MAKIFENINNKMERWTFKLDHYLYKIAEVIL
jgi:hypothetical protein